MSILSKIKINARAHDRIANTYELSHGEIFNPVEQARLRSKLEEAAGKITAAAALGKALDLGCGSGNLTAHLLAMGFSVTAADVSRKFLQRLKARFGGEPRLETVLLNGLGLTAFPDGYFNFTAAYSVLHHVPDYLAMVREMARVTAKGGVLYIDHEVQPGYWHPGPEYAAFKKESAPPPNSPPFSRFFRFSTYINKIRMLLDPRHIIEGDLHVWPDDHIEWDRVEQVFSGAGFETVLKEDYLLYRQGCREDIYLKYKDLCSDMRIFAARKL